MAAEQESEKIGPTAHYTAYVWQRLGLPYARELSTTTGALMYWGIFAAGEWMTRVLPGVPSMPDYLAYRHLLMDALLEEIAPDRLVELGAGLTQRTVEWALDRAVDSVDVDLPAMIAVKRSALAKLPASLQARLGQKHRTLAADVLAPEADAVLGDALAGARSPVVLAEGLVSYFDDAGRVQLFATVASALRRNGGGHFIADLHTADAQAKMGAATKTLRRAIRVITGRKQALAPFADEAALGEALLHAGFDGWRIARRDDYVAKKPALATTRSPAHIVDAWVG